MFNTIKAKNEAIDTLKDYNGKNPYILRLKRDVIIGGDMSLLRDFNVEYILTNCNTDPVQVNKVVGITDWYGQKLKDEHDIEFIPSKLLIIHYMGQTKTTYHCIVKYRQNMEPLHVFLPKSAVMDDFLSPDYNDIEVDFDRYDRLSSSKDPNRLLKEHQKSAAKFLLSRKKCILADTMGLGKLEPLSSVIPTEEGFKSFGELKIGDKVFGEDGKPHPITRIYEHKNKEIYKVTFSDNTYCYCGLDHLWKVRTKNMVKRNQGWTVRSLKELIDSGFQYNSQSRLKRGLQPFVNKYEIPVCDKVEYPEQTYLIHPYVLGVMIGDGCLCHKALAISMSDKDSEIIDKVSNLLSENITLRKDTAPNCPRYVVKQVIRHAHNPYTSEIKRLGLNVNSLYKFIPDEYKIGSASQRIELLRGLMDTDGTIGKNNRIVFTTNSETLANDVAELVFSLGGIARISRYIHKNHINPEFHVRIQIKENPFYLTRKREKYCPTFKKYCSKYIVSAEYDRHEDARCIMVDYNEHTYLTGKNYIVTHNTTSLSVSAIEGNFDSILIICPASIKAEWKKELMWYVPEKDITVIESVTDKNKKELEAFLGYSEGKSGLSLSELKDEAKNIGKWSDNRFVIINYDILGEFYKFPKSRSKENIEKAFNESPLLQYVSNKKSLIIVDEAHRLSNSKSDRYKIINDLIKKGNPDSVYLSTGTPLTNNPQNLYCLLKLIGEPVADDYNYYMNRFCGAKKIPAKGEKAKWTGYFMKMVKKNEWSELTSEEKTRLKDYVWSHARMITLNNDATNLDELRRKIAHIYLRREKEDLSEGLPMKHVHEVIYDFNEQQWSEYSKLWEEYEDAQLELDPEKEINKELLEGAVYRKYCSIQMLPNTIRLAEKFISEGEKVIIATSYDEELYSLQEHFGDKCVIFNGKLNAKQKEQAKKEFINNPDIMVFIGNIQASSLGLTLINSHIVIFNTFSYADIDNKQMEDRVYRIGQKHECDIYYQMFRKTRVEEIWNICLRKYRIFSNVIKKEDEKNKK